MIVEYKITKCPKCGWQNGYPLWSYLTKEYDEKKDIVYWICWDCGFKGAKDKFIQVKTYEDTSVEEKEEYIALVKKLVEEYKADEYIEVTAEEYALLLQHSPYSASFNGDHYLFHKKLVLRLPGCEKVEPVVEGE